MAWWPYWGPLAQKQRLLQAGPLRGEQFVHEKHFTGPGPQWVSESDTFHTADLYVEILEPNSMVRKVTDREF